MLSLRITRLRYLAILWLAGIALIGLATWACFALGLTPGTAGFVYLILIVVLSLWDSFVSSAIFSLAAVAALNYFFIPPLFTFQVQYESDIPLLGIVRPDLVRDYRPGAALAAVDGDGETAGSASRPDA